MRQVVLSSSFKNRAKLRLGVYIIARKQIGCSQNSSILLEPEITNGP